MATPPVRKLAKELGIDLQLVHGSGRYGTITREDVQRAAEARLTRAQAPQGAGHVVNRETRIPIRGVRKQTASAMVQSAFTAPHVTEFLTVDISATMELRERVMARSEFREIHLSPLVFVARALILAIRRVPEINAEWDEAGQEIIVKHYVNLGIAVATNRGLIVPNIRDAHELPFLRLATAIAELTSTARCGRTALAAMSQGTITVTNVGVLGVDSGTPILNPGESAILAVGAIRRRPWVVVEDNREQIVPRWVTTLALSFDHRLVDGQQGSQALADVGAFLTDPGIAIL